MAALEATPKVWDRLKALRARDEHLTESDFLHDDLRGNLPSTVGTPQYATDFVYVPITLERVCCGARLAWSCLVYLVRPSMRAFIFLSTSTTHNHAPNTRLTQCHLSTQSEFLYLPYACVHSHLRVPRLLRLPPPSRVSLVGVSFRVCATVNGGRPGDMLGRLSVYSDRIAHPFPHRSLYSAGILREPEVCFRCCELCTSVCTSMHPCVHSCVHRCVHSCVHSCVCVCVCVCVDSCA
jgi:hypothetical protein